MGWDGSGTPATRQEVARDLSRIGREPRRLYPIGTPPVKRILLRPAHAEPQTAAAGHQGERLTLHGKPAVTRHERQGEKHPQGFCPASGGRRFGYGMLPLMSRASPHPCGCGCDGIPSRGRYLRGHWLKQHRRDKQFISLDDLPESDGLQPRASVLDGPVGQLLCAVFEDALAHRQECLQHQ